MSVLAFILLNVEMASQREVLNKIRTLDAVLEAHLIFGTYDIIVKAEFATNQDLSLFVVDIIKAIPGVGETQASICAN
ncbi:MAG: Lrp/AsnC ligand binding domain-containing protein [Candidatus Thorarchaeota archaeon]|nr:Lrp/AsnC ligand binding domain-containing protein [Candidatus Thorarchaeota archaeon]